MKIKQMMAMLLTAVMTISSLPMGSLHAYAAENEPAIEYVADPADASDEATTDEQSEPATDAAGEGTQPGDISESASDEGSEIESTTDEEVTGSAEGEDETEAVTSDEETVTDAETAGDAEVKDASKDKIEEATEKDTSLLYLTDAEEEEYEEVAGDILGKIAAWCSEEKLLYIHDYIVTHCEYGRSSNTESTAYAVLVTGSSTTKGYAAAFKDLATKAGIHTDIVYSATLGHYWNRVKLGSNYYYVDVFNDDLLVDEGHYFEMCCSHSLFLRTREELGEYESALFGKESDDWKLDGSTGTVIYGVDDGNGKYSDAGWIEAKYSPVVCMDEYILYVDADHDIGDDYKCVKKYTFGTGVSEKVYDLTLIGWNSFDGTFATLTSDGTFIFINDSANIYILEENVEGGYAATKLNDSSLALSEEGKDYEIYGIRFLPDENKVEYWLAENYSDITVKETRKLDVSDHTGNVERITLDKKLLKLTGPNDSGKINATSNKGTPLSWESKNPTVATVDDNGNVTAHEYGQAVIEVSTATAVEHCSVWVDTTWQNDYEFDTDDENIILTKYKGTAADVTVPATAYEGGIERHTVLGYAQNGSDAIPVFKGNTKITGIKIESGVSFKPGKFASSYAFSGCTALTRADLSGVVFTGVTEIKGMFSGCSKLAEVKFAGCNMSSVTAAGLMFKNCAKLKSVDLSGCDLSGLSASADAQNEYMFNAANAIEDIMTPNAINNSAKITIPEMFEYKDGTYGTKGYTNLAEAPRDSRLVVKNSSVKTDISSDRFVMTLENDICPYDGGKEIKPAITVTDTKGTEDPSDDTVLRAGTDFTASYTDNKELGEATAYATGKGSYKGQQTKKFTISSGLQNIKIIPATNTLTVGKTMPVTVEGAMGNKTFSVTPAGVATIDPDTGDLTAIAVCDEVTIRVDCASTTQYEAAHAEAKIKIVAKPSLNKPVITVSPEAKEETGNLFVEKYALASISSNIPGAEIYYTLNGAAPDKAAYDAAVTAGTVKECITKKYAGAITIDKSVMTIKALAYSKDCEPVQSEVETVTYKWNQEDEKNSLGDVSDPAMAKIRDALAAEIETYNLPGIPEGIWYAYVEKQPLAGYSVGIDLHSGTDKFAGVSYTYTGDKITFGDEIYVFHGTRLLAENRDYTLSYSNNIHVGSADDTAVKKRPSVTIKGKGDYNSSKTLYFDITAEDIDFADITSDLIVAVKPGTALSKVTPSVSFNGHKLAAGKDFTAKYYIKAGEEFTEITSAPKKTKFETGKEYAVKIADGTSKDFAPHDTDKPKTEYVTVKVIDTTTEVQVSTLKAGDAKGKAIKLAHNGTVSVIEDREYYYGPTGKVNLEHVFDNSDDTKKPLAYVYVKKATSPLKYGTDYTVEAVGDSADAGKYTAIIHGTGIKGTNDKKYIGDKKITFEITGIPASKVKVAGLKTAVEYEDTPYSAESGNKVDKRLFNEDDKTVKAEGWNAVTLYTVTGSGKNAVKEALAPGHDYDLKISHSGNMGKFDVIFKLKGNYTGTIKKTVNVKACDLAKGFASKRFVYTCTPVDEGHNAIYSKGGARVSGVTITDNKGTEEKSDDKILVEGIDYTLSYKNDTVFTPDPDNMFTYQKLKSKPTITIKGKGNYTGSQSYWYFIAKADLTKDNVTMSVKDKVYKKKAGKNYFKVTPVFTDGGKNLTTGKNKDVTVIETKYRYGEDCTLENGDERFAGQEIPATDVVPAGTYIEVISSVQVLADKNPKSGYNTMSAPLELSAVYRILPAGNDISKAKVSISKENKAKLSYNNGYNVPMNADDFVLKLGGKQLPSGTYKIQSVKNNRYLGSTTVVFEGLEPYGGTKSYTFKITAKSMK